MINKECEIEMNENNPIVGFMCKDCTIQCTKISELIDCFVSTLEMRGFIRTRSNGTEKMCTCEQVYDNLILCDSDWIKDEVPYFSVDYNGEK